MEGSCYTLRCTGEMDCRWVAGFLQLFHERHINIRRLTLLPTFPCEPCSEPPPSRLEVLFDLSTPGETAFLGVIQAYVQTLPQGCQNELQPA